MQRFHVKRNDAVVATAQAITESDVAATVPTKTTRAGAAAPAATA